MDRHVKWLRRRIIASIATQTAETFAAVAVLAFAVLHWRTDQGPLTALFGSVVIAQLIAGARVGHAMRNNPLNYVFMRRYVDQPFTYRVSRFQGEDEAHAAAQNLPGFAPVATIRDEQADPEPVFDIYHDPSRLVAASVSRASGSISLISSLAGGRILVTDARVMPPHERLVMCLADDDSAQSVIVTHRRALSARTDVVALASSAHQVVLDSLALEFDTYQALGPTLSPFLDLEPGGTSWLRLTARIKPAELAELPVRLGPDFPMPAARASVQAPATASRATAAPTPPEVAAPEVVAPQVVAPEVVAPQVVAPEVAAPQVIAPQVIAPQVGGPELAALQVDGLVVPQVIAPQPAELAVVDRAAASIAERYGLPEPVESTNPMANVAIADERDSAVVSSGEPITAEVPAVVFTQELTINAPLDEISVEEISVEEASVGEASVAGPAVTDASVAEAPLDLAAALASLSSITTIEAPPAPPTEVAPVPAPVVEAPVAPAEAPVAPAAEQIPASLPQFTAPDRVGSLAEAVLPAPDTPAALLDGGFAPLTTRYPAPISPALISPALMAPQPPTHRTEHVCDVDPLLVPNLGAALGRDEELSPSRPRLSAALRANSGPVGGSAKGKRPRRTAR